MNTFNLNEVPKFQQKRLLTSYEDSSGINFSHITLEYKMNRSIPFNTSLNYLEDRGVEGVLYTCYLKTDIEVIENILIKANELLEDPSKLSIIKDGNNQSKIRQIRDLAELLQNILADYTKIETTDLKNLNKIIGKYILRFNKTLSLPKFDTKCSLIIFPNPEIFGNTPLGSRAHITVNPGKHKPDKMKNIAEKIYRFLNDTSNSQSINGLETLNKKNLSYRFNSGIPIGVNFHKIFYI
jgi:hypothetical protein